jgi:hypothetical protein
MDSTLAKEEEALPYLLDLSGVHFLGDYPIKSLNPVLVCPYSSYLSAGLYQCEY